MIQKIKGAQRTRKQAYKHILAELDAGRLGAAGEHGCVYESGKKHCAVGCLFSPDQLKDIKRRRLNAEFGVRELAREIGKENIEAVTGLELYELRLLQEKHDCEYLDIRNEPLETVFRKWLVATMKGFK